MVGAEGQVEAFVVDAFVVDAGELFDLLVLQGCSVDPAGGFAEAGVDLAGFALEQEDLAG